MEDDERFRDILIEDEGDGSSYSLIRHIETHLIRPKLGGPRQPHLFPSEASVKRINEDGKEEILGACMRQAYLRYTGETGEGTTPRSEFIFKMGHMVEDVLLDQFKEMGVWIEDDVEFFNHQYNLKGKLDAICKEPSGTLYGVEIKSFYGYYAQKKIIGNRSTAGRPKDEHLLQTAVYTNEFKNKLDHFKIIYLERGNASRNEFHIKVAPSTTGVNQLFINGQLETRFTIDDIYARYAELKGFIERQEVPPAEYKLYYDNDEIEYHHKKGDISKTNYEKFKKYPNNEKNRPGDWECSYCPFKQYCWGQQ